MGGPCPRAVDTGVIFDTRVHGRHFECRGHGPWKRVVCIELYCSFLSVTDGPHLTQCGLSPGLYLRTKWHLDASSCLATTDMDRKFGAVPLLAGGTGSPSSIMWDGPRLTSIPSFIVIHPTVWPQYPQHYRHDRQNAPMAYGEPFCNRGRQKAHNRWTPARITVPLNPTQPNPRQTPQNSIQLVYGPSPCASVLARLTFEILTT